MDQSCELAAVDEPDDVMEADTKGDKDEGMVGGELTLQCASHISDCELRCIWYICASVWLSGDCW